MGSRKMVRPQFILILIVFHFVSECLSDTFNKTETGSQESSKRLAPTFEEEWAALDVDDDTDDVDSFPDDLLRPYFPSLPVISEEALPWNSEREPVRNSQRPNGTRLVKGVQPGQTERRDRMASQLTADMEALGINQAEVDLLNLSASSEVSQQSRPTSSRFLTTSICGDKYLCRQGDRGPCRPNEIFRPLVNVSSSSVISSSCSGLVSSPWNGCFPAKRVGSVNALSSASQGVCTVRFRSRPCFGYPPGYRYSKSTRRCYPCSIVNQSGRGVSGPCSPNMMFVDMDGVYGSCRCRDRNSLMFSGNCYRMYSKGPCANGQWLEPWFNGYGLCKKSPCPSNKCDGRHIYWRPTPTSRGGCYKSFARGPCKHGSYFLIEDYATKRGRCVSRYGSSYDPRLYGWSSAGGRVSPRFKNRQAQQSSIWSNFGTYPAFGYDFSFDN